VTRAEQTSEIIVGRILTASSQTCVLAKSQSRLTGVDMNDKQTWVKHISPGLARLLPSTENKR
jgi:hypothetical protein